MSADNSMFGGERLEYGPDATPRSKVRKRRERLLEFVRDNPQCLLADAARALYDKSDYREPYKVAYNDAQVLLDIGSIEIFKCGLGTIMIAAPLSEE